MSKQGSKPNFENRKVSNELFAMTYGALVAQLTEDFGDDRDVNLHLEKIGYNIGLRLIEDFLAKNPNVGKCSDFHDVADILAKYGFKTYLGIVPTVTNWSSTADEFSLLFDSNPLTEFVELPADSHKQLHYSLMVCGVIRGALEMLNMEVHAKFVQDQLRDDQMNEIRVKLIKKIRETVPSGED